eukprot:1799169-Heterocapsa_arctica.AAC.1
MCGRIAQGIGDVLKEELARCAAPAFPAVAVGPPAGGEPAAAAEAGDEPWRRCPGCRWRVEQTDPSHTREQGVRKHPH